MIHILTDLLQLVILVGLFAGGSWVVCYATHGYKHRYLP